MRNTRLNIWLGITFLLSFFIEPAQAIEQKSLSHVNPSLYGGCPIANFAFTVQATPDGSLFGHVWQNTGKLGGWLNDKGSLSVEIHKDGQTFSLKDFTQKSIQRKFPFVKNTYTDKRILSSQLSIEAFAPLAVNELDASSLAALMTEINMDNTRGKNESFEVWITPSFKDENQWEYAQNEKYSGVFGKSFHLSCNNPQATWNEGKLIIPVTLNKGEKQNLRLLLTGYDSEWVSSLRFQNAQQTSDYIYPVWNLLKEKTQLFDQAIPATGMSDLDEYVRWYMTAGISLTRCTNRGEVLTLGYQELNQRDSFWTSWVHLILFKNLEWDMIRISYDHMSPNGKIPTCILPIIERYDDLDINLFLLLRTVRYYAVYHNKEQVKELWAKMCKIMDWVISRDFDQTGLPQQISYWGDWKDVNYIADRKYSPFVAMLYLASLNQMSLLAQELGDKAAVKKYKEVYEQAYQKTNEDIQKGGLWNGNYYCQIWKDGSVKDLFSQDQIVGVMYDVIAPDRADKLIQSLNQTNYSKFGISNTYPFIPDVRDPEAEYHNGGVWPWVCFMDAWARMHTGRTEEALELIRRVAKADLIDSGDYVPNEHLNSQTGENLGFPIQGWNAALFGTIYFNLIHPELPFRLY